MRPVDSRPTSHWRITWGRGVALAALLSALLAASVVAADDDDRPAAEPAIPPGEEALIAAMLGRGMAVGECALIGAGVEYTVIKATYRCPGGETTLELGHPQNATVRSAQTKQFAITVESGSPPPIFQHALASRIRSHERDFQWGWQERPGAAEDDGTDDTSAE